MYGYDGSMLQLYYHAGLIGAVSELYQATVVLSEEGDSKSSEQEEYNNAKSERGSASYPDSKRNFGLYTSS